jgi:hypothetical protein
MRWLAVWLLLTVVLLLGLLLGHRVASGTLLTRDDLAYLVLIPLAQVAALAALAYTNPRRFKR